MTDIGARSARVRARRCHGQRRRLRRAPLARPDRRASREAVRHTSFCIHTAERWLPLRTAAAMCPAFGGQLQQRSAQRHPRPPDRARLAGGRFRRRQEEATYWPARLTYRLRRPPPRSAYPARMPTDRRPGPDFGPTTHRLDCPPSRPICGPDLPTALYHRARRPSARCPPARPADPPPDPAAVGSGDQGPGHPVGPWGAGARSGRSDGQA